jgi:hypothetical protein
MSCPVSLNHGIRSTATGRHPTTIFRAHAHARARTRNRNRSIDRTYYSATRYIHIQMNLQMKF